MLVVSEIRCILATVSRFCSQVAKSGFSGLFQNSVITGLLKSVTHSLCEVLLVLSNTTVRWNKEDIMSETVSPALLKNYTASPTSPQTGEKKRQHNSFQNDVT